MYLQDVQDVRKMCARCVQGVHKMCARCAKDVCKMCARSVQGVRKMCARCAQYVYRCHVCVMFDVIEPHAFRKYSTCWVLQIFWEPCKFFKNFVHACVVNVIQGRALPGTVLYIENWIKVKKWRWLMFVSSIDPNLKNWPLLLGLDYSRPLTYSNTRGFQT